MTLDPQLLFSFANSQAQNDVKGQQLVWFSSKLCLKSAA